MGYSYVERVRSVDLARSFERLCQSHHVKIWYGKSKLFRVQYPDVVKIPRIKSKISYANAMCCLGYLKARCKSAPRLIASAKAWDWAEDNAAVWDDVCVSTCRKDLQRELQWASARQHRKRPPVIPPTDHVFWRLLEATTVEARSL